MNTLILDRRNLQLEYENQCLVVRQPDTRPRTIPLQHIRRILCLHNVQLTTSLLGQLWKRGIDFVTLNSRHSECSFGLHPNQQQQIERRCRQYQWQQNNQHSLHLARILCAHRLRNNLRTLSPNTNSPLHQQLQHALLRIEQADSLQTLLGIEGAAQRLVFAHWRTLIPKQLGFSRRQRRPPPDPVNALLSLTSTIVMQESIRQCTAAGLAPYLGFYHRSLSGRHSLACDLMEPVRPFIEQWVMHLFIDKQFDLRHFTRPDTPGSPCMLGKTGRERFYPLLQANISTWQRQLQATARWVCRHLDNKHEGND